MYKPTNALFIALLGLLLCSCAASTSQPANIMPAPEPPAAANHAQTAALGLLPGCLAIGQEDVELAVTWSSGPDGPVAEVWAANLTAARALYFSLPLDDSVTSAATVSAGEWAGEGALSLAIPVSSRQLHVGIAMLHPQEQSGFTGEARVATINFSADPQGMPTAREAAAAPLNSLSRIDLDYNPASNRFAWYYRNLGDYDQNGEVNIADLTPIAIHFGKSSPGPFPEESIESVVDGDANGEINIADISPIGVGFGSRQDSFNIYSSTPDKYPVQPNDPSLAPVLQNVAFSESTTSPSTGRLRYAITSVGPSSSVPAYWLRPVDDESEGIASLIAGLGNQPPQISLTASTTLGLAPLSVTLDASSSVDPEGGPLEYLWAVFDITTNPTEDIFEAGGATRQYELDPGTYRAIAYALDEDGAAGAAVLNLTATPAPGWLTSEVDVVIDGYEFVKMLEVELAEVAGDPWLGFCYEDSIGAGRSGVVIGNGLASATMDEPQLVTSDGSIVGAEIKILPDGNNAHIFTLLKRATLASLRHARMAKGDPLPDSHSISTFTSQKQDISVALVEERPAVSFHDETSGNLNFALADNNDGSVWPVPSVLADLGDTGEQTNLAVDSGAPVIVYYSPGGLRIRLITSAMVGGQPVWEAPTTIKPLPNAVLREALQVLPGGDPWLLVHDLTATDLYSMSGPNFAETSIAATTGNAIDLFDTALVNELVCIAWYDKDEARLKFLRSANAAATSWEAPQEVASSLLVGALSLTEIDGHAGLAWFDGVQQTVHLSLLVE